MSDAPACAGFRFAGIVAGIKSNGRPDLGLVVADEDVPTAAVFDLEDVHAAIRRLERGGKVLLRVARS